LVSAEISEKFSRNRFFLKFHVRISTEFETKRDKFQVKRMSFDPQKKSKEFHTRTNLPFSPGSDQLKIYCQSCGPNLGLKSQPKLNRNNDERLVKISDQNTQGVRRTKSYTESEQNWFSENKTSCLFFPVSSFCHSFMDVHPYLGACRRRPSSSSGIGRSDFFVIYLQASSTLEFGFRDLLARLAILKF